MEQEIEDFRMLVKGWYYGMAYTFYHWLASIFHFG
jgi:hypothetical protein